MSIANAAHCSMMGGGKKPWTNPYITDGLVAMFDGEWNAGGGVHADSILLWKNLVSNYDIDISSNPYISITSNSLDVDFRQAHSALNVNAGKSLANFSFILAFSAVKYSASSTFNILKTFTGTSTTTSPVEVYIWPVSGNARFDGAGGNVGTFNDTTPVTFILSLRKDGSSVKKGVVTSRNQSGSGTGSLSSFNRVGFSIATETETSAPRYSQIGYKNILLYDRYLSDTELASTIDITKARMF